jgi:hypothetical protein
MKSLNEVTRWLHVLVATLAVWSQARIEDIFKKLDFANYALVGTIIVATLGILMADKLAMATIDEFRWLRRILSGKNDIEGDWVDVVAHGTDPCTILKVEYSRIRFRQGRYILSGDSWTVDGHWMGDYITEGGANYSGRQLEFYYKTGMARLGGFGICHFAPEDSIPVDFVCRYIDEGAKSTFVTRGHRVNMRFRKVKADRRRQIALEFAQDFDVNSMPNLHLA